MMRAASLSALIAAAVLVGCGSKAPSPAPGPASDLQAADAFLGRLREHCGQAFAGSLEVNEPADPADPFATQALVMHVRECGADELRIPFHVGTDRSRTWVLTRTASGLRSAISAAMASASASGFSETRVARPIS